jgi:hypothetical protein
MGMRRIYSNPDPKRGDGEGGGVEDDNCLINSWDTELNIIHMSSSRYGISCYSSLLFQINWLTLYYRKNKIYTVADPEISKRGLAQNLSHYELY